MSGTLRLCFARCSCCPPRGPTAAHAPDQMPQTDGCATDQPRDAPPAYTSVPATAQARRRSRTPQVLRPRQQGTALSPSEEPHTRAAPAMDCNCNCFGVATAARVPVKRYNLLVPDVFPVRRGGPAAGPACRACYCWGCRRGKRPPDTPCAGLPCAAPSHHPTLNTPAPRPLARTCPTGGGAAV